MITLRETLYDYSESNIKDKRIKDKIKDISYIIKNNMQDLNEIQIPIQLLEKIFGFDTDRDSKHWINCYVTNQFKSNGFRLTKVRNKYKARFRKIN